MLVILAALLSACGLFSPDAPTPTTRPSTITPTKTPTITPTASPTPEVLPPNTFGTVDASTFYDKVVIGYQGWFGCPTDDSGIGVWWHWFSDTNRSAIDTLHFEFWPDTSELTDDELCPTGIQDAQGNDLYLYSAFHPLTVKRHFLWMAQYGIDGIELQRFATELQDPRYLNFRDQVLANVQAGAEDYGRVFYIQYDGIEKGTLETIKEDWKYLIDTKQITSSPSYLHHKGLPVVGLWGIGFAGRDFTPEEAQDLIDFFKDNPDPKYRATVQGGVPSYWRTLTQDSASDPAWAAVFRSYDIINPWHVNAIGSKDGADFFLQNTIIPDIEETNQLGIDYMPVAFSGFSWSNLYEGFPLNQTPRDGGTFLWRLAYNDISQGVKMLEIAMFDEVDEGTAIFKMVESADQLPPGEIMLPLDVDGYTLPSDWYLTLAGRITQMLRGEIELTPEIADLPERDLSAYQSVYITFTTQSDWNTLAIQNAEIIKLFDVLSVDGPITDMGINTGAINLTQTFASAEAGYAVSAHVQYFFKPDADLSTLNLVLRKGNIGWATVRVTTIVDGQEIELVSVSHRVNNNDGNALEIIVPLDVLNP